MRRARIAGLLGAVAFAITAGLGSVPAGAASPRQQGWWITTNPGSIAGLPQPPAPPDVPADGLLIEGGLQSTTGDTNAGPTAFAALVYDLPTGTIANSLTLTVAANSATTPNSKLQLCPLALPGVQTEAGGPMAHAPTYDCGNFVTVAASASGSDYAFDVSNLASNGVLAVAVLPTSVTDRVVLAQPDANSLATVAGPATASSPTTSLTGGDSAPSVGTTSRPFTSGLGNSSVATGATPVANQAPIRSTAPRSSATLLPDNGVSLVTVAILLSTIVACGSVWTRAGRAAAQAAIRDAEGHTT